MKYSVSDFRRDIRSGPYAWPGGYPLYFVTSDGGVLSFATAKAERRMILESIRGCPDGSFHYADDWRVVGCCINWEDGDLRCDHSGEQIESAYAEEETDA